VIILDFYVVAVCDIAILGQSWMFFS